MPHAIEVLEKAVGTGVTAGAVALVRHNGEVVFHHAVGSAALEPESRPIETDTVFDLASLTKPLVGATVTMALADKGVLSLDEEVTYFLPELESLRGKGITFRRLLTHTSGLPGWRPLYVTATDRQHTLETIARLGQATSPGTRFEYSDIGFVTLGLALEAAGGSPLDELAHELVFSPLRLDETGYLLDMPAHRFAATEQGNVFEKRMSDWAGLEFARWRTDFHPGEVNDGNAHYALGGVSGHAGLFSTASDLGILGEMWLNGGEWAGTRVLSRAAVDVATGPQTDHSPRGLGWQLTSAHGPSLDELSRADAGFFPPAESAWNPRPSGELQSDRAFGHTGFTGTSIWVDPIHDVVMVLLTNATHPKVNLDKPVNAMRARFHNAVISGLGSSVPRHAPDR